MEFKIRQETIKRSSLKSFIWRIVGVILLAMLSGMKSHEIRLDSIALFGGRVYLAYLAVSSLSASTHYTDAIEALDALRVAPLFTAVAGSICRWFEVVRTEITNANNARLLRGGNRRGRLGQLRDITRLSTTVMTRSYQRAERVAEAMECRGFHGKLVRLPRSRPKPRDFVPLVLLAACLAAIWVVAP